MNPLHIHDIIENLKEGVPRPLGLEGHSCGSDPITHKKVREETTAEKQEQTSSSERTVNTSSSSPDDTQRDSMDRSSQQPAQSTKTER